MPKNVAMTTEIPLVELPWRATLLRPRWSTYQKDGKAYLREAVALSMNTSPGEVPRFVNDSTTPTGRRYNARLRAARLEMVHDGAIKVIEKGREDDGSDWIIDLKSFVTFALGRDWGVKYENFKLLGAQSPVTSVPEPNTKVLKAPPAFVAAFIILLVEIASRAAKADEVFDVRKMPGQKTDLRELAHKLDAELIFKDSTFDTYIKGLCQFKQGASKTDFYRKLFPESFNTP